MMKSIRKWSRILHRDIGFLCIGVTLIYGISGIALNHLKDWNPNYSVDVEQFQTNINLEKSSNVKNNVLKLLDEINDRENYRKHYYPNSTTMKIFLDGGSSAVVDLETGKGTIEILSKRALFYQVNFLHYNPSVWWMWFSDIYAGALIFLALSSLFMLKGRKGTIGRGGIYALIGIILPILFLIFL
jgi:hypothetical protein